MHGAPPDKKGNVYFNFTPYRQHANQSEKGGLKQTGLGLAWDRNGRMHIVLGLLNKNVFRAGNGFLATDIVYAYSDDGGRTAHKPDGTPISFPIGATDGTPNQGDIVLRERDDPKCKWLFPWPNISVDKADRPIISAKSYVTGNHLLRLEGGKWVDYQGDVPDVGSTDPNGVIIGKEPSGNLRRYWNPTGKNFATLKLPDEVYRYDAESYRDTGDLVWISRNGSAKAGTLTIYRTVFAPAAKAIGAVPEASDAKHGTQEAPTTGTHR